MQIKDYTAPELEHFREACNFTSLEREFFDLRAAGGYNRELRRGNGVFHWWDTAHLRTGKK